MNHWHWSRVSPRHEVALRWDEQTEVVVMEASVLIESSSVPAPPTPHAVMNSREKKKCLMAIAPRFQDPSNTSPSRALLSKGGTCRGAAATAQDPARLTHKPHPSIRG